MWANLTYKGEKYVGDHTCEEYSLANNDSEGESGKYSLSGKATLDDETLECKIEVTKNGDVIDNLSKEGLSLKWYSDGSIHKACSSSYCSGNVSEDFNNVSIGLFKNDKRIARTTCGSDNEEVKDKNGCLKLKVSSKTENRVALKAVKLNGAKGDIKWHYSGVIKEECKFSGSTAVCPRFKCFDRTIKVKLIKNGILMEKNGQKCADTYANIQRGCPDPEAPDPYIPFPQPVMLPPPMEYYHSGFN